MSRHAEKTDGIEHHRCGSGEAGSTQGPKSPPSIVLVGGGTSPLHPLDAPKVKPYARVEP